MASIPLDSGQPDSNPLYSSLITNRVYRYLVIFIFGNTTGLNIYSPGFIQGGVAITASVQVYLWDKH